MTESLYRMNASDPVSKPITEPGCNFKTLKIKMSKEVFKADEASWKGQYNNWYGFCHVIRCCSEMCIVLNRTVWIWYWRRTKRLIKIVELKLWWLVFVPNDPNPFIPLLICNVRTENKICFLIDFFCF